MNKNNLNAMKTMVEGIKQMIDENNRKTSTIIENCVVLSVDNVINTCTIKWNGATYTVEKYGSNTLKINSTAKLFVPNGNMKLAFVI